MLRILSLLLLSLTLLTTACSKDDPQPEPTLEGTWKLQRAYFRIYSADGTVASEATIPPSFTDETMVLENDSLTFSRSLFGIERVWPISIAATSYKTSYKVKDQTLTLNPFPTSTYPFTPLTIVRLTGDTLEIQQEEVKSYTIGPTRTATGGVYTR